MFVVPIAMTQVWLFSALALVFFGFLMRAMARRQSEAGGRRAASSRVGIIVQGLGMAFVVPGTIRPALAWSSVPAITACLVILLLMSGAIALFASSSAALGKNWSFQARTRSDHELIRSGPYAYVRHPIYLGMMLFMLAWAAALGHWANLIVAVPLFVIGTKMRTAAEDRLLEASFGQDFIAYRNATPALFPRLKH